MKRKNWLPALLLCICLLVGLTACGARSEETSDTPAATASDGTAAESNTPEKSDAEESSEKTDDETAETIEQDVREDGEARDEITMDEALELVIDQFGTEDPDTGYSYDYSLERADEIDGRAYYIYRQSWAPDEEDGEAGAKVLSYIFVATDGSVLYTGVIDGEESVIDYDTEVIV